MSPRDAEALRAAGHDTIWTGFWPSDPGDAEILRQALEQGRVLVTLDADFGALLVQRRFPHAGVIYLRNVNPREYVQRVLDAIDQFGAELERGAFVIVRKSRIRLSSSFPKRA